MTEALRQLAKRLGEIAAEAKKRAKNMEAKRG